LPTGASWGIVNCKGTEMEGAFIALTSVGEGFLIKGLSIVALNL
jgi:hypothetical protein